MNRIASRFALLGLALSVVSYVTAALAQESVATGGSGTVSAPLHRAPDPQKQAGRLARRLGLNDDQTARIASILQSRQQQLASARSDSTLTPKDRHSRVRSIQQDADSQIRALLTPEQQKQYAELKQNMKDHWQNARGAPNAGGGSAGGPGGDSH